MRAATINPARTATSIQRLDHSNLCARGGGGEDGQGQGSDRVEGEGREEGSGSPSG